MPLRSTVVDVDLDAIVANYHALRARAEDAEVIAVVKDDAYGHGVEAVAETLAEIGVAMLAVFTVEEALTGRAYCAGKGSTALAGSVLPHVVLAVLHVGRRWVGKDGRALAQGGR